MTRTYARGAVSPYLLEMERGMARIAFEQRIILVGQKAALLQVAAYRPPKRPGLQNASQFMSAAGAELCKSFVREQIEASLPDVPADGAIEKIRLEGIKPGFETSKIIRFKDCDSALEFFNGHDFNYHGRRVS